MDDEVNKIPIKQREYKVGNKKPPKEHQFKPGQSGNPAGPPKARTQLWRYVCIYLSKTDKELEKIKKGELTQAQQAALKAVENIKKGKQLGSGKMARYIIDRDEGKATERLLIGNEDALTDDECDEIRDILLKNNADK